MARGFDDGATPATSCSRPATKKQVARMDVGDGRGCGGTWGRGRRAGGVGGGGQRRAVAAAGGGGALEASGEARSCGWRCASVGKGCFCKIETLYRDPLKQGLRVNFL